MDFGPAVYRGSWPGLGRGSWLDSGCVGGTVGSWIRGFVGAAREFVRSWIRTRGGFVGSWRGSWIRGFVSLWLGSWVRGLVRALSGSRGELFVPLLVRLRRTVVWPKTVKNNLHVAILLQILSQGTKYKR